MQPIRNHLTGAILTSVAQSLRPLGLTQGKRDRSNLAAKSCLCRQLQPVWILPIVRCLVSSPGVGCQPSPDYRHSSHFLSVLYCLIFFSVWGKALSPCSWCFLAQSSRGQCTTGCLAPAFGTNSSSQSVRAITWQHLQQRKIHLFSLVC